MRVLVTGCGGYIGTRLIGHLLRDNLSVVGLDSLTYKNGAALLGYLGHPNFRFVCGDARDITVLKPLVELCDVVVHLAALVGAPACEKYHSYAQQINADCVETLVECLNGRRLVFPATNSGYGVKRKGVCTEEDPLNPVSIYGLTKCQGEQTVLSVTSAVSLRLATVFGPSARMRFDLMVNDFVRKLYRLKTLEKISSVDKLVIFQPHFRRNFVHIDDVCRAMLMMVKDHRYTGPFNCGHPDANLTKWELAHLIRSQLGLPPEVVVEGEGTDPDMRDYLVSNDKLLATGFEFRHGLREGIHQVEQVCQLLSPEEITSMGNFV